MGPPCQRSPIYSSLSSWTEVTPTRFNNSEFGLEGHLKPLPQESGQPCSVAVRIESCSYGCAAKEGKSLTSQRIQAFLGFYGGDSQVFLALGQCFRPTEVGVLKAAPIQTVTLSHFLQTALSCDLIFLSTSPLYHKVD